MNPNQEAARPPLYFPVDTPRGIEYAVIPTGMSEEYFDFMVRSLEFHAKNLPGFIVVEEKPQDPERPSDAVECDHCGGSGHDGFDREHPPNPYVCGECDGRKWVSGENDQVDLTGDPGRPNSKKDVIAG